MYEYQGLYWYVRICMARVCISVFLCVKCIVCIVYIVCIVCIVTVYIICIVCIVYVISICHTVYIMCIACLLLYDYVLIRIRVYGTRYTIGVH
jgi:hypothetical protein